MILLVASAGIRIQGYRGGSSPARGRIDQKSRVSRFSASVQQQDTSRAGSGQAVTTIPDAVSHRFWTLGSLREASTLQIPDPCAAMNKNTKQ